MFDVTLRANVACSSPLHRPMRRVRRVRGLISRASDEAA